MKIVSMLPNTKKCQALFKKMPNYDAYAKQNFQCQTTSKNAKFQESGKAGNPGRLLTAFVVFFFLFISNKRRTCKLQDRKQAFKRKLFAWSSRMKQQWCH